MGESDEIPTPKMASESSSGKVRHRGRPLLKRVFIVVTIIALAGLAVSYAPQFTARYLIADELEALGIKHDGLDTLRINPWTSELWIGPVSFGAGASSQGQLAELGLSLQYNPLLKKRVSIERLIVRQVDLAITRDENGTFELNGIPLNQWIAQDETAGHSTAVGAAWSAGIDVFELRDSKVIFKERDSGELEIDIDRLALTEFQNWAADQPGRFELAARVNDILLNWSGEARLFATDITFTIDSRTENADVPKLARFIGPLGLDRQSGNYDADLKYQVTLYESGRLEGHTQGSIQIHEADYERENVYTLAIDKAKLDLDLHYSFSESRELKLKGDLDLNLGTGKASTGKRRYASRAGRISLTGLEAAYLEDGLLSIAAQPVLELENIEFSGPIEISLDSLAELMMMLQSLTASKAVSMADTGMGDLVGESLITPSSAIKILRFSSKGGQFALKSDQGQVELGLDTTSNLSDIHIGMKAGDIEIAQWRSALERLNLASGQGQLTLEISGSNSLKNIASKGEKGELNIAELQTAMDKLILKLQTGGVSLQLNGAREQTRGASILVYRNQNLPEVQLTLESSSTHLNRSVLEAGNSTFHWQAEGETALDKLTTEFDKGKKGAVKFVHAELNKLRANDSARYDVDALIIDGLDMHVKRSLFADFLQNDATGTEKAESSGAKDIPERPTAPPPPAIRAPEKVDVGRVQTLLTQLGHNPGPIDGRMGKRTAAAIRQFQQNQGMTIDGRATTSLLTALESGVAGPGERKIASTAAGNTTPSSGVQIDLKRFALTGNPTLRFRDDMVTPNVKIDTVFKQVEIRNLNTVRADQRSNLKIAADVNEFTHINLEGWTRGAGETADLDLKLAVDNLELSSFSPYVTELSGVHLESGQLDTAIAGKSTRGKLLGEIGLQLDNVTFQPLSAEEAERVTGAVGVPLETAVGLLQDDQGRISLTLPVSGTLSQPDVDISLAVNKAIGGALKKVFPPAMVGSFMSGLAKGSAPSFVPIEFEPGSAELSDAGRSYGNELAQLLTEHPKLSVSVCGRSTARDLEYLQQTGTSPAPASAPVKGGAEQSATKPAEQTTQALTELAVERKRNVRRYLIEEKRADIKRVRECRSKFEASDQDSPRVEVVL
ncbi:MAG: DUF748 domain-containing protein [Gammaproteobacteria bacterium]|nr:DUF748 domain-containing protein [Gammaproteobacteria bacterium]